MTPTTTPTPPTPTPSTPTPTGHTPGYSRTFPRAPASVRAARALVRAALTAWGLDTLADDAALTVSELVTNAVRHTRSPTVEVTLARPGPDSVRIDVHDNATDTPHQHSTDTPPATGRGLIVVNALAHQWGHHHTGDTDTPRRTIWAVLTTAGNR